MEEQMHDLYRILNCELSENRNYDLFTQVISRMEHLSLDKWSQLSLLE